MKKTIIFTVFILMIFGIICAAAQDSKKNTSVDLTDIPAKISVTADKVWVPMELFARKPVVEVKINGQGPFKLFLDTGAGATVLNQDLADELNLPGKGTTKIGDPTDPEGITANKNLIEKLEIGGAVFSDFIAVSFNRSALYQAGAPRGVLGMPLFVKLLLTIDYPQNKLVIAKGDLPKSNGADILDYQVSEAGLFGVPLKIAGKDLTATLDTGAQGGLSFPNEYMEKLPLTEKPKEIGRGRTVAGEAIIYGAKLNGDVGLGQYKFENLNVTFFGRLTHLNIGYGFLNQFAVTVDQKNKRLKFDKTAASTQTVKPAIESLPITNNKLAEYTGLYGERRLTIEQGALYLQRLSGPQGEGPKIKLVQIKQDEFALDGTTAVRIKFVRAQNGEIGELQVLTPGGEWEISRKNK